ncbi:bifunctional 4-hydroxy-2-oxoglutarate aldolase/2-dehydro-3-deoxy-phosphogluconate aldolase [Geodermatophilus sp. CPCC 205506]|uniref:bifunctional 4-hydroxy-2-oxoglutarate aldolase/2-dehydro-3-deoxy-phosphogluconate aldolase n=1 Tax=Geodermatophilus sp. CPCC 205506 TaxID=2936596 RepID=UPI003EE9FBEA
MTTVDAAVLTGLNAANAPCADSSDDVLGRLTGARLVPVATVEEVAHAEPLARALVAGGLPCVEVTMRTPAAEGVLARMAEDPNLLVGAGTVVRPEQVERVVRAGARFVVTPGFSSAVVAACREVGVPVIPGVATATEVIMGLDAALDVLKFFPAEAAGGVKALAALSAPFAGTRFIPTGGISLDNTGSYLEHPAVIAVGGSWMVAPSLLSTGDFAGIEQRTREAVLRVASLTSADESRGA